MGTKRAGALGRWQSWWISAPARDTGNPVTRFTAVLMRARTAPTGVATARVVPTAFVGAVAAAQLGHRSGSAQAPIAAAIGLSCLLALPLMWRRQYPAATFTVLALVDVESMGGRCPARRGRCPSDCALHDVRTLSGADQLAGCIGTGTRCAARRASMGELRLPAADAGAADRDRRRRRLRGRRCTQPAHGPGRSDGAGRAATTGTYISRRCSISPPSGPASRGRCMTSSRTVCW